MQKDFEFAPSINVRDVVRALLEYKFLIIAVMLFFLISAYFHTLSEPPVYRATAKVLIKSSSKGILNLTGGSGFDYYGNSLNNEMQFITSRILAEDVVRAIAKERIADSLELFGRRRFKTPLEKLMTSDLFGSASVSAPISEKQILGSTSALQGRISVKNIEQTDFLLISVTSTFPDEAAYLANAVCKAYRNRDIQKGTNQIVAMRDYIREELENQRGELAKAEEAALAYARSHKIYGIDSSSGHVLSKLIDADAQYRTTKAEYNISKRRQEFLVQKLSSGDQTLSSGIARNFKSRSGELQEQIRGEQRDLAILTGQLGEDDPQVIEKKKTLLRLRQQQQELSRRETAAQLSTANRAKQYQFGLIGQQLQNETTLADLDYAAGQYLQMKNSYESQLSQLPETQLGYARLLRDQAVLAKSYTFLREKLEETNIAVASQESKVTIVDPALLPGGPESPNMQKSLMLAAFTGLVAGAAISIALELLSTIVPDSDFIKEKGFVLLAEVPLLGKENSPYLIRTLGEFIRPLLRPLSGLRKVTRQDAVRKPLWITAQLSSPFAESFRELRNNIIFSQVDRPIRSLLVSGPGPGDGKTTICSNLALAFALTGKKVLVIDADLRIPAQHHMFSVKRSPGLSDYLAGVEQDIDKMITQSSISENLFLLPAGSSTPHPNELLESKKMSVLIKLLEQTYDLVLIDSPPLVLLSDALLLSKTVDNVLLVARVGRTSKAAVKKIASLNYIKPHLLGFAVIEQQKKLSYNKYNYYYKYQQPEGALDT